MEPGDPVVGVARAVREAWGGTLTFPTGLQQTELCSDSSRVRGFPLCQQTEAQRGQ